jgi:uncharacterized protein (TIGR02453 family)
MPTPRRATKKPAAAPFGGFDRALPRYLASLAAHNEKAWFDAHRDDYERLYHGPAKAFTAAILPKLAKLGPGAPQAGGLMRIYRDTRFSKDKTPYKTALHLRYAATKTSPALMFRITRDSLGVAAGCFGFDPKQLARYREALGDPTAVRTLRRAITKAEKAGYALPAPHLARVPRGFDADHPAGELLRRKGLSLGGDRPLPAELFGPRAVETVLARFRELWPVYTWLTAHVT